MARTEYKQLEFQRQNPHLFTTPTQSVNADGSILTFETVTAKLQEVRDKLVGFARQYAASHNFNADYWHLMPELAETKKSVDYIDTEIKKALKGFTDNYVRFHNRAASSKL